MATLRKLLKGTNHLEYPARGFPAASARWCVVLRRLTELDQPGLHAVFVKAAVSLALDRSSREREMTAQLLAALSEDRVRTAPASAKVTSHDNYIAPAISAGPVK